MKRSQSKLTEKYEALARVIDMNGPTIKRVLEEALADRSPRIKALAAEGIGKKRIKSLLPNLLAMIRDKNSWVRRTAIESIGQLSSSRTAALAIVDCLNDKEKLVRVSTAEALGEIGKSENRPRSGISQTHFPTDPLWFGRMLPTRWVESARAELVRFCRITCRKNGTIESK